MIIAGIDYSLSCPSVCVHNTSDGQLSFDTVRFYVNQERITKKEQEYRNVTDFRNIFFSERLTNPGTSDTVRYQMLADWTLSILWQERVEFVSLEGYALGAKGLVFNIAEATGLLKYYLQLAGIGYISIPPSVNKKSFTGKGNANKALMIEIFRQKTGIDIANLVFPKKDPKKEFTGSPISDIVDSYSLIETYFKETNYGSRNS